MKNNISALFIVEGFIATVFGTLASAGIPEGTIGSALIWTIVAGGAIAFVAGVKMATKVENAEDAKFVSPRIKDEASEKQAA